MAGNAAGGELTVGLAPSSSARPPVDYAVAQRADESEIRALLRESAMPGAIRVSFTREPDFFQSCGLVGAEDTTIIARRGADILGMGRCSARNLWINGQLRRGGYLCELRVRPSQRGGMPLLRGGFRTFASLEAARAAEFFFTSIATSNTRAQRILERAWRYGLPRYERVGDLITLAMPAKRRRAGVNNPGERFPDYELKDFVLTEARRHQLTLPWNDSTWSQLTEQRITTDDFVTVARAGRIVAAAAIWDQRAQRQTVIQGYSAALAATRSLVNVWSQLRGRPGLPKPGTVLAQAALVGLTVKDATAWPELWEKLQARASVQGIDWLTWSTDARDPDARVVERLTGARVYRTKLYEVRWDNGQTAPRLHADRLFRPEVSLL